MATIEVLSPGIQTTVQDYPGRVGHLASGYYPAGPMDHYSHRLANALVGNDPGAATLEITLGKIGLRFSDTVDIAVTGAKADVSVNGEPVAHSAVVTVPAGGELRVGGASDTGFRLYLAVAGGIDIPAVLGSRATYTMGQLGGVEGRALRKGDVLPIGGDDGGKRYELAAPLPEHTHEWVLDVTPGPHATPEYLDEQDLETLFATPWQVDRNANRTGVRLEARRLKWARASGGIAGGHPSNILDNGYPLGGINLNGDTPVILAPDGPTAGGFVVVAVVCHASLWKLGQLRPGTDTVRLNLITIEQAQARAEELDRSIAESLKEIS
ncbi:MAG: 5-oxoprolinase/urea amidolyase family protein [Microbacterium sp.]|uniref:5-oxoprolinase/urea amidolyase family protein n=1 Tax=Microbacterium sp. TaxID=51671 RepID=UPI0039E54376